MMWIMTTDAFICNEMLPKTMPVIVYVTCRCGAGEGAPNCGLVVVMASGGGVAVQRADEEGEQGL